MILVNEGVVAIPVFPRRPVQPILWTYFTISTDIFLLLSLDLFLH